MNGQDNNTSGREVLGENSPITSRNNNRNVGARKRKPQYVPQLDPSNTYPDSGDTSYNVVIQAKRSRYLSPVLSTPSTPASMSESSSVYSIATPSNLGSTSSSLVHVFETPSKSSPIKRKFQDNPLPNFKWADRSAMWSFMHNQDTLHAKDVKCFDRHQGLGGRMRAILLDWLGEVSEVYRLHRETYYLAIEYFDRFMSIERGVEKSKLQLIGITCLFIASKMEEIYPPKINEFSFVTDGACSNNDIIETELKVAQTLDYALNPMTADSWLILYMQLFSLLEKENGSSDEVSIEKSLMLSPTRRGTSSSPNKNNNNKNPHPDSEMASDWASMEIMVPTLNQQVYQKVSFLLDMAIMDEGSMQFKPSVLAAASLYHFTTVTTVTTVTGLTIAKISKCINWMQPIAEVVRESSVFKHLDTNPIVVNQSTKNLQHHVVNIDHYDTVTSLRAAQPHPIPSILMTPPIDGRRV